MNTIAHMRQRIPRDVFDYQILLDALSGYSKPRDKITRLLVSGVIVRVKKGLYIFGENHRNVPVRRCTTDRRGYACPPQASECLR